MYKKYTMANCPTQHCSTCIVQTYHISMEIYNRQHKPRLVATGDTNCFLTFSHLSSTLPHVYTLYPSQSPPFHCPDVATQDNKHCAQ